MSPLWGFKDLCILCCYKHAAPLGLGWFTSSLVHLIDDPYTLRSAPIRSGFKATGARGLAISPFYRPITPVERKTFGSFVYLG